MSLALMDDKAMAPWDSSRQLSVTVGPDDEEDTERCMADEFEQWRLQAGPSSSHVDPIVDIVQMDLRGETEDYSAVLASVLDATNVRLFQPMPDQNFVDEMWSEKKPKIINGYLFGETLGEGSYGKVKEVLQEETLVRRAVKIIKASRMRKIPNGRVNVEREMRILARVRHKNVIELTDVFRNELKQKLYLVFEYCVGSLQQMLDATPSKRFPPFQAHQYFTQLIRGLAYLHSQGIVHKDIKPGNLLIALDDTLKISDVGVAEELDRYDPSDWCSIAQGTPKFQPPEVVSGILERFRGPPVDVWACGITLYNLLSGQYPFEGDVIMKLYENIAKEALKLPAILQEDAILEELIRAMLDKDPDRRATVDAIIQSPWFRRKLMIEPEKRVPIPVCNNAPAHRPLSVYAALEQMFGVDAQVGETLGAIRDSGEEATGSAPIGGLPKRNRSL